MIDLSPLGTGIILPAVVIGFEIISIEQQRDVDNTVAESDLIITVDQQAGGMMMTYPRVLGCVMRLSDNAERCRGDADFLISGFRAMSEESGDKALLESHYKPLRTLTPTSGWDYSRQNLKVLDEFLACYFDLQGIESGIEAFIRFVPCDVTQFFGGWSVMKVQVPQQVRDNWGETIFVDSSSSDWLEQSAVSEFSFDSTRLEELKAIGASVGLHEMRAFFLWENCD